MWFFFNYIHSQGADNAVVDKRFSQFNKHQRMKATNMLAGHGGVVRRNQLKVNNVRFISCKLKGCEIVQAFSLIFL